MARTLVDAHRSLQRFLAQTLGDDWDVWPLRTEPQEQRPWAVVKPVEVPTLTSGSKSIIDMVQPFIAYLYPPVPSTGGGLAGQQVKLDVEEQLYQAFFVDNSRVVPLYDYTTGGPGGTEIPWDGQTPGPATQSYGAVLPDGTPTAPNYMKVREYRISSAQDAVDERRWSITLTLRLSWRRHGHLVSGTPVAGLETVTRTTI